MYKAIDYDDFISLRGEHDPLIADVRDHASYQQGHIPGAMHLSIDSLTVFCREAEQDKVTLVYCYHGITSQSVALFLVEQGFKSVYSLNGGYQAWVEHAQGDG